MDKPLGKLAKVELREYWVSEEKDFTPWLAQQENLELLGQTIGLDLGLVGTEQPVGEFSADVVAEDAILGKKVIIENQLDRTDHDHLGKLITYASGLQAGTVVWVAPEIREKHRQALNWLNDVTDESVNFFGLEVELWRIGDSAPAPHFNVVCQPNDWGKGFRESVSSSEPSKRAVVWLEFWTGFTEFCKDKESSLPARNAAREGTYTISLGVSNINLCLVFYLPPDNRLCCGIFISHKRAKDTFDQLLAQKDKIEAELGAGLEWVSPSEEGRRGRIYQCRSASLEPKDAWPELYAWMKERAEAFYKVFVPRVEALTLEAEEED